MICMLYRWIFIYDRVIIPFYRHKYWSTTKKFHTMPHLYAYDNIFGKWVCAIAQSATENGVVLNSSFCFKLKFNCLDASWRIPTIFKFSVLHAAWTILFRSEYFKNRLPYEYHCSKKKRKSSFETIILCMLQASGVCCYAFRKIEQKPHLKYHSNPKWPILKLNYCILCI